MELWEGIVLGIIQGLTEFLPVSSSGHLVIFQDWLGIQENGVIFEVAVHLGTALAVLVYFRKHLWEMAKNARLVTLIIVASLPAAVLGIFAEDFFEGLYSQVTTVALALFFTGGLLWYAESKSVQTDSSKDLESLGYLDALIIGFGQALAIIPGISRSGSTISAGLLRNVRRETMAEFSFLMSVPVILGAALLQLNDLDAINLSSELGPILAGTSAAFASGLAAIFSLLAIIRRSSLKYFSYYVWALGLLIILLNLL